VVPACDALIEFTAQKRPENRRETGKEKSGCMSDQKAFQPGRIIRAPQSATWRGRLPSYGSNTECALSLAVAQAGAHAERACHAGAQGSVAGCRKTVVHDRWGAEVSGS
jgi:hypothetical protein